MNSIKSFKYGICARQQLSSIKTVYNLLKEAKTADENYVVLQTSFRTLTIISNVMSSLRHRLQDDEDNYRECIYFEVAFFNLNTALSFMKNKTITPHNKPYLLSLINAVITHLEKSEKEITK